MAAPEPTEEIVIKLDGKVVPLESLPPEVKADVDRRIKEGRESYAAKYPAGKLRMNINVKVKTSREALKAAGIGPSKAKAPSVSIEPDGPLIPYPIMAVLLLVLCGALYLFVPAVSGTVDKLSDGLHRSPAATPAAKPK